MVDLKAHAIHGKLEGDWICAQGSPGPGFHVSRAPVMLPWERERRPVRLSNWAFPMRRPLAARQPLPGPAQKLPLSQSRHPLSRVPTHSLHVSRVSLRLKSKAKLLSSIASWRELQKHLSLSQEVVSLQPLGESGWSDVSPAAGCEASAAAATCPASDAAALFLQGLF